MLGNQKHHSTLDLIAIEKIEKIQLQCQRANTSTSTIKTLTITENPL